MAIRCRWLPLVAAGLWMWPTAPVPAQTKIGDADMSALEGSCNRLVIGSLDLTDACSGKLLSVAYPDGRVGFYFVLNDGRIVTFTGMDGDNPTPDTDVVNLDRLIMTRKDTPDQPDVSDVSGTCAFGNPFRGAMTVSCEGSLPEGIGFTGSFTTDGQPPK